MAWLSVDEADNDRTHFLTYLVAAVHTIAVTLAEAVLGMLESSREDPQLPLSLVRGRGQLSELRASDLRFTPSEAAAFLNQSMCLNLSAADIATLESRTEGWIAGLQLAALSLRGHPDTTSFIQSFSGSHRFVLDYLLEEVLHRQSESVQTFLLRTSILEHLSGPLCDAVLRGPTASGQATLEYLERANLFLVPLHDERRWYRYHQLFADLLRQRLHLSSASSPGEVTELHARASQWYEAHGMEIEAFQHAAAANDVERAERLIEGQGVPLQFRGAGAPVLKWLESLPAPALNARPSLWVTYATALFFVGRHAAVEQKLQAAEAALHTSAPDDTHRDLVGRIASIRATLAIIQRDVDTIIGQSRRALEYLDADNLPIRTAATYTLGYAHQLQGDRAAASRAYADVIRNHTSTGDSIYTIAATLSLGQIQEANNQLRLASRTYAQVLELVGNPPRGLACEAHVGLARIHYEWNDLEAAQRHAQHSVQPTRRMESLDTFASYGILLARLRLAQGDMPGAASILDEVEEFLRQHDFLSRLPDVTAAQVLTLLRQGRLVVAAQLANEYELPISQARVYLAGGNTSSALMVLERWRERVELRVGQMNSSRSFFSRRSLSSPTATRTGRTTCSLMRWRWPSQADSCAVLLTKARRWPSYCLVPLLTEGGRTMLRRYWRYWPRQTTVRRSSH